MAKQLSMEDLIKKYQYLKTTQQTSSRTETNQKTNEKDNAECSSKIIFLLIYEMNDYAIYFFIESSSRGTSARSISNTLVESSSSAPTSSENACKVCLDAEANCAFIECGHIVSCLNCAKLLTRCPVCRAIIKRTLRVYKS